MTIDEAIARFYNNSEYERLRGNLQGCLEFKQLEEWLKDYKKMLGAIEDIKKDLGVLKTKHELRLTNSDIKSRLIISNLFCEFSEILNKHTSGKEDA